MWLDTCVGLEQGDNALLVEGGSIVKTFNCEFDSAPTLVSGAAAPIAYLLDAP